MRALPFPSRLTVTLLAIAVVLTACSTPPAPTNYSSVSPKILTPAPSHVPPTATAQLPPDLAATATLGANPDWLAIQSFHTLLLLERADDLILVLIPKIQSGEIPVGDPTPRYPYTDAFALALEVYNQTTPPPGDLNHPWKTVSGATQQFSQVYNALIQGKAISGKDLINLRIGRQMLTNYHNLAEGYLKNRGVSPDFFVEHQKDADRELQEKYGAQQLPSLSQDQPTPNFVTPTP